jgi:hypothetical protein
MSQVPKIQSQTVKQSAPPAPAAQNYTQTVSYSLNSSDLEILNQRLHQFGYTYNLTWDNLTAQNLSRALYGNDQGASLIHISVVCSENSDCGDWYANLLTYLDSDYSYADVTFKIPAGMTASQFLATLPQPSQPAQPTQPPVQPPVQPPPTQPAPDAGTADAEAPRPSVTMTASASDDGYSATATFTIRNFEIPADADIEIVPQSGSGITIEDASLQPGNKIRAHLNLINAEPGNWVFEVFVNGQKVGQARWSPPVEEPSE